MAKPLKTLTRRIADGDVTCQQFAALRALRLGGRLGIILSPLLAGAAKGLSLDDLMNGNIRVKLSELDVKLDDAVPGALKALAETLDPEALAVLAQDLLVQTTWSDGKNLIDLGQPGQIDAVFGGELPDLFAALKLVLETNDFFGLGAIGKLRGALAPKTTQASPVGSTPS